MEPMNYLTKHDVLVDMRNNQPFRWSNLEYGFAAVAGVGGVATYAVAKGILEGAAYLCIGGCSLYSGNTTVVIAGVCSVIGGIASFIYPLTIDCKNNSKEKSVNQILNSTNNYVSKSQYEEIIKILGTSISHDLDKQFTILSNSQVEVLLKEELNDLTHLLEVVVEESEDPVKIYNQFIVNPSTHDSVTEFLKANLGIDNVDKIYRFAKANKMTDLTSACNKYFTKNMAIIGLERFFQKKDS